LVRHILKLYNGSINTYLRSPSIYQSSSLRRFAIGYINLITKKPEGLIAITDFDLNIAKHLPLGY
jgi:hypothetical protein